MNRFSILLIVCGLTLGACCDEDFINPDYDFFEFAIDVTSRIDSGCNPDAAYTTVGATPDGENAPCFDNPIQNRWFKFQAPGGLINIFVYVGGSEGTQQRSLLTLWDTDGLTELNCTTYYDDTDDLSLFYMPLTPGEWYYFTVDTDQAPGTFSICLVTD